MSTEPKMSKGSVTGAIALALVIGAGLLILSQPKKDLSREDPIFSREVISYQVPTSPTEREETVAYEYVGEVLPEKLAPDEDVSRRTENSYTRVVTPPTSGSPGTYQGVFYTQPTFTNQNGTWHYIEHATTTETALNTVLTESPLAYLFARKAHAVDIYSGAGDGHASATVVISGAFGECGIQTGWNDAHASAGTGFAYTGSASSVQSYRGFFQDVEGDTCTSEGEIYRGFVPFVTSSIPAGATITSATLSIYALSTIDQDNDGIDYITVVETNHAGHTTLAASDYDNCGAITTPTEGIDTGQRKDITSISTAAYTVFTLNATGLGFIKKSGQTSSCSATNGVSCFGLREGHDATDSSPLNTSVTGFSFYTSENTGTANDPYLSVTYTGGASSFWQFQDF